jgi:hypothetical protein
MRGFAENRVVKNRAQKWTFEAIDIIKKLPFPINSHDYEGKKSKPEWGLNLSKRNLPLLSHFAFDDVVQKI